MIAILRLAWDRFNLIASIMGDVQGRILVTVFYFTLLAPFGIASRLMSDPLHLKQPQSASFWQDRAPVPQDLDSARDQG